MKFFHLSDLHIGLKLMNRDLREDQEYVLRQVVDAAVREKPDAIVVAGDIYDRANPSGEAVEVFDRFVTALSEAVPEAEIMMISGNHDSPQRVNVFRVVLGRQHIRMIGLPPQTPEEYIEKVTLRDEYGVVNFYLLPFVKPSMVQAITGAAEDGRALSYDEALRRLMDRENIDEAERNVLVSHQFYLPNGKNADEVERMDSEIRTVGNIDEVGADILERFDYAALGHIHKPMRIGGECRRYSGTPLACSVSEAGQEKSILSVEFGEKGRVSVTELPLAPLRAIRVVRGTLAEALAQGCGDYVSVRLTDTVDLDTIDMQERLRAAYPNLLDIRREAVRQVEENAREEISVKNLDPFTLCREFLGDMTDGEQELLRDVVNKVQEVR